MLSFVLRKTIRKSNILAVVFVLGLTYTVTARADICSHDYEANCLDYQCGFPPPHVCLNIDAGGLDIELTSSCSVVYAVALSWCISNGNCDGGTDDSDSEASCYAGPTSAYASAQAGCPKCCESSGAAAEAYAEVANDSGITVYQETCACIDPDGHYCTSTGVAVSVAKTKLNFSASTPKPTPLGMEWCAELALEESAPGTDAPIIQWRGALAFNTQASGSAVLGIVYSDLGLASIGLTEDEGVWSGTDSFPGGTGNHEIITLKFLYDNDHMDVDGSGRFNGDDVDELESYLESTDPELLERFDFNSSGDIDQEDVDVLEALVDAGLHAGVFGDALGNNGTVDCPSPMWAGPAFGYTLGQAGYKITLDFDLDGDTDSVDEAAYEALCD